jgi:hypothetical protein
LGAIYFLLSAITAVKALVVVGFATPHPNDWIRNREASKPLTIEKPDKTYLLYVITTQNDIELNIRANYLDATLLGLRNGVILLSVALGAALFDVNKQNSYINSPSGPQTTSSPASPKTPQNTEAILPEIPKTPDGPKRVKGAPLGERPSTKQTRDQHKR